jgi:hypothetical protein
MRATAIQGPDGVIIERTADHEYMCDTVRLPHVTGVLKASGVVDARWYTHYARQRGLAVHVACDLIDEDNLDADSVDPRLVGYLDAYLKFLNEHNPAYQFSEELVYSNLYRYAGTLDRAGVVETYPCPLVIDLKTGDPGRAVRLQLSGYAQALREQTGKMWRRASLWLRPDGTYRWQVYDQDPHLYREDLNAYLAALTLLRWMNREEDAT